jgi:D-lactate dehydrogenase
MKVAIFSTHKFDKDYLLQANNNAHDLIFLETRLTVNTASLATGCEAVSLFTSDNADAAVLDKLNHEGIKYLALRTAGYNNVDLEKAKQIGITVARVPGYSPYAVAEHTVALMLAMNRNLIRAHQRIMDLNFSLDGLTGFDMQGKTAGIIGTGKIGCLVARILYGFGCRLLACDEYENEELKSTFDVKYVDIQTLVRQSDIITLHIPLSNKTKFIIDKKIIDQMKRGVMLVNTSRGKLVKTEAVLNALKTKQIGFFGMDVYEEEEGLFFEDHSEDILMDDIIARLMTFKNVLITSHQGFLTTTALKNIGATTIYNLKCFEEGVQSGNEISI